MSTMNAQWNLEARQLWERIGRHPFTEAFISKLMQGQGWNRSEALAAIEEYRRFSLLACVDGNGATPSDQVDEVWHLHLTHTRDYWNVWCASVLRMPLHHEPSRGSGQELAHYRAQYAQTLARYEAWFADPPARWWPGTRQRFRRPARFRRIDLEAVWVLPRPRLRELGKTALQMLGLCALASTATALSIEGTPLDWSGPSFLGFFALIGLVATVAAMFWRRALRGNSAHAASAGLSALDAACLIDGPHRCLDTAIADLLRQNAVRFDPDQRQFVVERDVGTLAEPVAAVRDLMRRDGRADQVLSLGLGLFGDVEKRLQQKGLLLDRAAAKRAAWMPALLPGVVLAIGVAKIMIGVQRDRPVVLLVLLCLLMLGVLLLLALRPPRRSLAGDGSVSELRRVHARAARAPRETELPLAVALLGTAAMAGTAWAGYHQLRAPPSSSASSDSSSSSSDSGSSDSGGGDSGGGCGGCGGGGGD